MSKLTPPVNENDNLIGSRDFKTTLVEYGDYECPHCRMAHPIIKHLLKMKGDSIRFVFRNFPLQSIHTYAMPAALAAEAASQQNQFWTMHDLLFENQDILSEELFLELAGKLKLDLRQFQTDQRRESIAAKVKADFRSGLHSGVNGTPSFFIDNIKIEPSRMTYESLLSAMENI